MLSDEELAMVLRGKADKLAAGEKDREAVDRELAELLAADLEAAAEKLVRRGPTQRQGRVSFGRPNEGREGLALFVPDDWLDATAEGADPR